MTDTGEEPDFDYRLTLTREILAMRDTVQGWQRAGSPNGLPVDLAADRALSDAVQPPQRGRRGVGPGDRYPRVDRRESTRWGDPAFRLRRHRRTGPGWCRTPAGSPRRALRASAGCWCTRWCGRSVTR